MVINVLFCFDDYWIEFDSDHFSFSLGDTIYYYYPRKNRFYYLFSDGHLHRVRKADYFDLWLEFVSRFCRLVGDQSDSV